MLTEQRKHELEAAANRYSQQKISGSSLPTQPINSLGQPVPSGLTEERKQQLKLMADKYAATKLGGLETQQQKEKQLGGGIGLGQFGKGVFESTKSRLSNIGSEFMGGLERGKTGVVNRLVSGPETGLRVVGQAAGLAGDVAGETLGLVGRSAMALAPESVKKNFETDVKNLLNDPAVKVGINALNSGMNVYKKWKENNPNKAKDIEAVFNIASIVPFGGAAETAAKTTVKTGKEATEFVAGKVIPKPKALEAVGQVLQGKTSDIKTGVKALKEIDLTGIKKSPELLNRMDNKIQDLKRVVDASLEKDPTKIPLKDLTVTAKNKLGKEVTQDYVSEGLKNLKELYTSIGDNVEASNIDDLVLRANTDGLTRKEINDIARQYGNEFSQKAFSKIGEPLTSVNAQRFENTRKGLKEIARQSIGGKEAQAADEAMSSLLNTKKLIAKNIEAVNKLSQKIAGRGPLEKLGHAVTKYADLLSGGSIRGFIGGLLPRGAGYKVMNALDLEEVLSRNLEIIQKAIKTGNDSEFSKLIKELEKGIK